MVKYNLEERTLQFSKRIIKLCKFLPKDNINYSLINQIIRSGTSVGANYREANETETIKDFQYRIRISKKEAKETHYWLELIVESNPSLENKISLLLNESNELVKIFATILKNSKLK